MKKSNYLFFLTLCIFFLLTTHTEAQYRNLSGERQQKQKSYEPSRWFAGGMLGGGFSSTDSYIQIAPIIGYEVTPEFQVGTRLNYIYQSYKDFYGQKYNLNNYGGSLFLRYRFFKYLFAQTEYEILSVPVYPYELNRRAVNSFFIGGGIIQSLGGSGFFTMTILYNLLDSEYSPYSNPLFRVGFGFGF